MNLAGVLLQFNFNLSCSAMLDDVVQGFLQDSKQGETDLEWHVLSHRELLQAVWGPDYGDQVDYLRVFVKNLRKKIEANPEHPQYIMTEPWVGYRFKGDLEFL